MSLIFLKFAKLKVSEWVFLLVTTISINHFGSLLFETRKSTIIEIIGISIVAYLMINLLGFFLLSSFIVTFVSYKHNISRMSLCALLSMAFLCSIYTMFAIGSRGFAFAFDFDHQLFLFLSMAYGLWTFMALLVSECLKRT